MLLWELNLLVAWKKTQEMKIELFNKIQMVDFKPLKFPLVILNNNIFILVNLFKCFLRFSIRKCLWKNLLTFLVIFPNKRKQQKENQFIHYIFI
jgi:hypothetical protein